MVYCADFRGAFSSAARRDAVLADIQTRITGKPRWTAQPEVLQAIDLSADVAGWASGLIFSIRFTSRLDAEDLIARVQAFATGLRAPLAGSILRIHDCPHDQPSRGPCAPTVASAW